MKTKFIIEEGGDFQECLPDLGIYFLAPTGRGKRGGT